MIGETVLGVAGGVAALGGGILSALGKAKKTMWVLWITKGAMVAKGASGLPEAQKFQEQLKQKGRSSVIVTKKPDGTFEMSNQVTVTRAERKRGIKAGLVKAAWGKRGYANPTEPLRV